MFARGGFGPFGRGFGYGMGYFGGYGFLWIIGMVILIAVIVYFMKGRHKGQKHFSDSTSRYSDNQALSILKERYAKGEITEDEYERMKKVISKKD